MQLFALGLNHHCTCLDSRTGGVQPERLVQALGDLVRAKSVKEAAILSTCNRTELYFATEQPQDAADWFAEYHRVALHDLSPYLYTFPQRDAVRHVFRVASGLVRWSSASHQILGQVKDAVRQAEQAGTLGTTLHKLFQRTFSVAKEVRSTTAIGANTVSMAAAAVHLSERIFERGERAAGALRRRRRNDRTLRSPLRRRTTQENHHRQPHPDPRRSAGGPLRRRRAAPRPGG